MYDVRVKNPLTLANYKSTVTLEPGVNNVNLGTLLAGDSSNDNVVDVLDFSYLRASFGTRANQADFNGDGVVDVLDFSLLAGPFWPERRYPHQLALLVHESSRCSYTPVRLFFCLCSPGSPHCDMASNPRQRLVF